MAEEKKNTPEATPGDLVSFFTACNLIPVVMEIFDFRSLIILLKKILITAERPSLSHKLLNTACLSEW